MTKIELDGRLNENVWQTSAKITTFYEYEPEYGQRKDELAEVHLFHDNHALYVGGKIFVHKIRAYSKGFDSDRLNEDDHFMLMISFVPPHGYFFQFNPLGTRRDGMLTELDYSTSTEWDGNWYVKTAIYDSCWCFEMMIPFANFPKIDSIVRMQMKVYTAYDKTTYGLRLTRPLETKVSRFYITNLANLSISQEPITVSAYTGVRKYDKLNLRFGGFLKAKWKNFNISATVLPDYSEIEADPVQINLFKLPYMLPEKRKFFYETEHLTTYLYTRRIEDPLIGIKGFCEERRYSLILMGIRDTSRRNFLYFRMRIIPYTILNQGITFISMTKGGYYDNVIGFDTYLNLRNNIQLSGDFSFNFKKDTKYGKRYKLGFLRKRGAEGLNLLIMAWGYDPLYNPYVSFVPQNDVHKTLQAVYYKKIFNKIIHAVDIGVGHYTWWTWGGEKIFYRVTPDIRIDITREMGVGLYYVYFEQIQEGRFYYNNLVGISFRIVKGSWKKLHIGICSGRYFDETLVNPYADVAFRLGNFNNQIEVELFNTYTLGTNKPSEQNYIFRYIGEYMIVKNLLLRTFQQMSTVNNYWDMNFSIVYDINNGCKFICAYNGRKEINKEWRTIKTAFVAKLEWTIL